MNLWRDGASLQELPKHGRLFCSDERGDAVSRGRAALLLLNREAVEDTLAKLARQGSLVRYPPLVEDEGVMVAQYEHSIYLGPQGVEVLTA